MLIYEITAAVPPSLTDDYERYMREHHIPALLATGCFRSAALVRAPAGRYRIRYHAPDQAALDRYLATYAEALRVEFIDRFAARIELSREVWTVLQHWPAAAADV